MNRILAFFGLMKIKRAKNIGKEIHIFFERSVLDGVQRDFGVPPRNDPAEKAEKWWEDAFDKLMTSHTDDVEIVTKPIFAEYLNEQRNYINTN
ncbi:MAG TPA: hypothetical protein DDX98_01200 [Bacteroidales bacterium]|jgi:hypothetical protein|nr:hypothetical protein [Bacteroidales bacterium]